ncbi:MAG TPA: hypothetical protein VJM09_15620, partial [Sphingobium sp.]|nr:hypothetical protein [Sphingobium sp.]
RRTINRLYKTIIGRHRDPLFLPRPICPAEPPVATKLFHVRFTAECPAQNSGPTDPGASRESIVDPLFILFFRSEGWAIARLSGSSQVQHAGLQAKDRT